MGFRKLEFADNVLYIELNKDQAEAWCEVMERLNQVVMGALWSRTPSEELQKMLDVLKRADLKEINAAGEELQASYAAMTLYDISLSLRQAIGRPRPRRDNGLN